MQPNLLTISEKLPSILENHLESMSGLSPVWRDLPYDLILHIIGHTNDRSTLKSWSYVNRLLGSSANRRLWKSVSLKMLYGCIAPGFNEGELDALVRACYYYTVTPAGHLRSEPILLIENLEICISGNSYIHHSSPHLTQLSDYNSLVNDHNVMELISSLPNLRAVYLSGHINQPVFRKFLAVSTLERLYLRVPLRMRTFYEHGVPDIVTNSLQRPRFRRSNPGPLNLHKPLKLGLLTKHQNLRVLSIHQLLLTEACDLAFAVRTLQLTELDVSTAVQDNYKGFSPLGIFLMALGSDEIRLVMSSDPPPPRVGFPTTLKKLILNEDNVNCSKSHGLYRILGNATMGCDNITYLHLGFPIYESPPLFLLRDLHLPALTDLSLTAFMHFTLVMVGILEGVSVFSKFCAAHKLISARFEICHAWRSFAPEAHTSLIDAINKTHVDSYSSQGSLKHPAFDAQLGQPSPPPVGGSERFQDGTILTRQRNTYEKEGLADTASSDRHEHPVKDILIGNAESNKIHKLVKTKIRYVAREIRLAVGAYLEDRIYSLVDILFSMDSVQISSEKKSERWGTELSRICLDKVIIDQTIWNLDHVDSLSNLQILAVNQVCHSKASCIGHVAAYWSLNHDIYLCKKYSPRRDGDTSANACPAKRRVLKFMAEALVRQCAKQLPSLQMVYLDSERFWIEREDGEVEKVWRLWDAMDHSVQKARIDCKVSLEDWAFLSCQDVDDTVVFRREEVIG